MAVRKTEQRIPPGLSASDLGQSASSGDVHLISYLSSPIVDNRVQSYIVFVEDASMVPTVSSYEWEFDNNGVTTSETTSNGAIMYAPTNLGNLSVTVTLKDGSNTALATVSLQQNVIGLNPALEVLVDATDTGYPAAGHPLTSREVINELRIYVDATAPVSTEDHLNRLLLAQITETSFQVNKDERNQNLEDLATLLDSGNHATFLSQSESGIGVGDVRPQLLAMVLNEPGVSPAAPYIPLVEIRSVATQRTEDLATITTNFNALSEDKKIDLFNRLRFPKSNISMCRLIMDDLLNRYYSGSTFENTLNDRTKARILITQLDTGLLVP